MIKTPQPFDEKNVEKFWVKEAWDNLLPEPGFVTDFVLATRGLSSPTKFCVWTALFLISSVVKRDVELLWKPLRFYPNLYIFLVAPPCFCGKSTIIDFAEEHLLATFHKHILNPVLQAKKEIRNSVTAKCTPESLVTLMKPLIKMRRDLKGDLYQVPVNSELTVTTGELAVFLGKQQYNMGLIQLLTSLYDCKASDRSHTLSRGAEKLKNIYVTLIGGITQTGLENSIPEATLEEGFLSRVLLISQDIPTRLYTKPRTVIGGPSVTELQKRLAWIAENAHGVYQLSNEAKRDYKNWYGRFVAKHGRGQMLRGRERDAGHLLKVSLLLRIQRYEKGKTIEMKDYVKAKQMIESLQEDAQDTTGGLGLGERVKKLRVVRKYVKRRGNVPRRVLQKSMSSRGILTDTMDAALRELKNTEEIEIILNGKSRLYPGNVDEEYKWIGGDK